MESFAAKVKHTENWLLDRPLAIWGTRAVIWLLLFVWVFPVGKTFQGAMREDAERHKGRTPEIQRQLNIDYVQKAKEMLRDAKASGYDYGPRQYYADLRYLESRSIKDDTLITSANIEVTKMQELMRSNCKPDPYGSQFWSRQERDDWFNDPRKYVQSQITTESQRHSALQGVSDEDLARQKKQVAEMPMKEKMAWLWGIWLRGMFPMFILYLLRLTERKGILETILADIPGFIAAITNWPIYCFMYPKNVLREIVVEAELRRIGGVFRSLNPVERFTVRRIAHTTDYDREIARLRKAYTPEHQRGVLLGLLATLVCLILLPAVKAEAKDSGEKKQASLVFGDTRAGPTLQVTLVTDHGPLPFSDSGQAVLPEMKDVLVLGSEPLDLMETQPPKQLLTRRIDHVPDTILDVESRVPTKRHQGENRERYVVYRRTGVRRDVHPRRTGLRYQPG